MQYLFFSTSCSPSLYGNYWSTGIDSQKPVIANCIPKLVANAMAATSLYTSGVPSNA